MKPLYSCKECSAEFERYSSQVRDPNHVFCSRSCRSLWNANHDKPIKQSQVIRSKFVKCCDYYELSVNDINAERGTQKIIMSHYAMLVWNRSHHGSWMLHGHSHGGLKYPVEGKILDAGIDAHNYFPISYDEVKAIMSTKKTQPVDHHE